MKLLTIDFRPPSGKKIMKTLLIMKLTSVFLLAICVQVNATGFPQSVTLSEKNASLQKVFKEINKQTGFQFFYKDQLLKKAGKVSIEVRNVSLEVALSQCLKNLPIDFSIVEETIVLRDKETAVVTLPTKPEAVIAVAPVFIPIKGIVNDENGNPLSSVSVLIKGTKKGTTTNVKGEFTIDANPGDVLEISIIGYKRATSVVGSSGSLVIQLEVDVVEVLETVVVGYTTQRKKDVAAAISKITADDIQGLPIPTVAQAMQGRAAGVVVSAVNGIPGGSIQVIIRGVGSLNAGSEPLYVVDGVQINTNNSSAVTQNNPLGFLNTNDIESIEVLKDAAAAAIYGARAGNGVVLITTKKGSAGKTKTMVNIYIGQAKPMQLQKVLTSQQWLQARTEAVFNAANPAMTLAAAKGLALTAMGLSNTLTDKEIFELPSYDWQDAAFRTGKMLGIEMSMQGGNATTNFYLSGTYTKQEAIVIPMDYERGTMMLKVNHAPNKKFNIQSQVNLSTFFQNAPLVVEGSTAASIAYGAIQVLPINPIYNPDGSFFGLAGSGQTLAGSANDNAVAVAEYNKYWTRTNQLVGSLAATYNINNDFSVKTTIGLDYRLAENFQYQDPRIPTLVAIGGRAIQGTNINPNFITTSIANFRKTFKDVHNVTAVAGVEYRKDVASAMSATGTTFPSEEFIYLSSAAVPVSVSGSWTGSATWSQFTRLGYNYKSRYIVGFTLRRDGSSRFGENNRYGLFPSAQFAWNAKDEKFLNNVNALSELKFRYSFGRTGNDQIGNFDALQLYGAGRVYNGANALNPTRIGNPDLTWETREENNIGMDLGLLKNRINLSVDVYKRINKDLLMSRSIYGTTGFTGITQNVGKLVNKGVEILLKAIPFNGKFKWASTFNIAFQKQYIAELYAGLTELPGSPQIRVGENSQSFLSAAFVGINPSTGRAMYLDKDGNITYTPVAADRKILGNSTPTHVGGWTHNLTYKGFELDVFFQYEYGRNRSDGQLSFTSRLGNGATSSIQRFYDDRWTTPGQVTSFPAPFDGQIAYRSISWQSSSSSSIWYFKTDYIRLKQATLAYNIPASILKRAKLSSLRAYVQGINLWTYHDYPGYDPEFTGGGQGIVPQSKNVTVGIQLGF